MSAPFSRAFQKQTCVLEENF